MNCSTQNRESRLLVVKAGQLCDHLLALDPTAKEPEVIRAGALEAIAQNVVSGIGRNYSTARATHLATAMAGPCRSSRARNITGTIVACDRDRAFQQATSRARLHNGRGELSAAPVRRA